MEVVDALGRLRAERVALRALAREGEGERVKSLKRGSVRRERESGRECSACTAQRAGEAAFKPRYDGS